MTLPAPPAPTRMTLEPTLEAVARTTAAFHAWMPERLGLEERHGIEIGLAEALTNIVVHGYAGWPPAPVEVLWQETADSLLVELRDRGRPIPADRLDAAGPEAFAFDPDDLEHLPEGGFGLALVKAAFDTVDYECADGINCLRLAKRFE